MKCQLNFSLITGILFVAQKGIMLQKSKEDMDFLKVLMDWLQNSYQELKDTEVQYIIGF